jgi:hypothetical protein
MAIFFRIRKSALLVSILLFIIAVLSIVLIACFSRGKGTSVTASPSVVAAATQKKGFSIGGKGRENQKGGEIADNFRKISLGRKESSTGDDISSNFKKIRLGKEKSTTKRIWKAPHGVQPGTLVVPDIQVDDEQSDVKYVLPLMRREKEVVMELGTTQHGFDKSNNLEDGITGETWAGDRNDWDVQKVQVKQVMLEIMPKFDEFLTEIWKDAPLTEELVENDQFSVKTPNGACVSLDRFYEFVQANVNAQMGSPFKKPDWMKGSALDVGFANLEKSRNALRELLIQPCGDALFTADASGRVLKNGVPLQVKVPWPRDGSLLFVHEMKK